MKNEEIKNNEENRENTSCCFGEESKEEYEARKLQAAKNLVAVETEEERLNHTVIALKNFFFNPEYYNRDRKGGHWIPAQEDQIRNRFHETTPEMLDAMAKDYPAFVNRMGELMRNNKYNTEELDHCYQQIHVLEAKLEVYEKLTGGKTKNCHNGDMCGECKPCDF